MKAIVFGGSGFLGSHVADSLTEAKHEVIIFDKKASAYINKSQKMVIGDILDEFLVNEIVRGQDVVFNFAGISSIDECAVKPVDAVKFNILGNVIILEAAVKAKIKRFVFASSAYVYSNVGAFYKNSKQSSELFIDTFGKDRGLDYTIVRYGSLYGPRTDENNSIYKIIKQAINSGKIDYHGTGDEIREYIHVKDAARLTVEILKEEYKNQHIVLTGNQSMEYRQLLNMIKEILNNKVDLHYLSNISKTHYTVTPYSFFPKLGKKLTSNPYIDMGQGLLEIMEEVYKKQHKEMHQELGVWVNNEKNKLIFLSHILSKKTPVYMGLNKVDFKKSKSINRGDSSNVTEISLSCHLGTHIDFPLHFIQSGKSGEAYAAKDFVFKVVKVIDAPKNRKLIYQQDLDIADLNKTLEILFIKTGMGSLRDSPAYYRDYPGIHSLCAGFLKKTFPKLRAVGIDLISLSSAQNRQEGRLAHREFLRRGICIIEDMDLRGVFRQSRFKQIILAPLLFEKCDGSPCMVLAELKK